jgi:hypothetical protein
VDHVSDRGIVKSLGIEEERQGDEPTLARAESVFDFHWLDHKSWPDAL